MYTLNEKQLTELRQWLATDGEGIDAIRLELVDSVIAELLELRKLFLVAKFVGVHEFADHCRKNGMAELAGIADKYAPRDPVNPENVSEYQVASLVMLVKRISYALRSGHLNSRLPLDAQQYLKANGLISGGDILR
ncbi:hypothetical protein NLN92_18915 [Citrobacter portucalensis]|uniref:hypothetical protein n=1 Tax=Citrobacter portucalensis TaxID=1639133 RepID=UPI00226BB4BA|nr:hypothetical protein [Citrobacter portucalensis]MCX8980078.1 hypothetical protein [Citrobacter portucalensis]